MWLTALWNFYNAKAAIYFVLNVFDLLQGNKVSPIYPSKEETYFFLKTLRDPGGHNCAEFWTWGVLVKDISGDIEINEESPWIMENYPVPKSDSTFPSIHVSRGNPSQPHYPLITQTRSIKQSVHYLENYIMEKKMTFLFPSPNTPALEDY